MYTYPRIPQKSPNCCVYINLGIDICLCISFVIYSIMVIIKTGVLGLLILLLPAIKCLITYHFLVALLYPEKVKSNRSFFLFFSVLDTSLYLIIFIYFFTGLLELIFKPIKTLLEVYVIFILTLSSGIPSASGCMNLLYIREIINSETSHDHTPQVINSYSGFRYIMN